jgi:ABC-type glutathione transport system ATPase component
MANSLAIDEKNTEPLLRVRGLSKNYIAGGRWRRRVPIAAVNDVGFEIQPGQTLALVGASGSGKSTVARCVTRLEQPNSGEIWFAGRDIAKLSNRELLPIRMDIQMIFQDAVTSLNPRFSAAETVEEPLRIQGRNRSERRAAAEAVVRQVALSPTWLDRSVMDFSGGQRQRLAIARALTTQPKLLVLDEAFSGLDLPTQAQIANLLMDLQAAHALSYLLISHDLALVAGMADVIAVMAHGQIVEQGIARNLIHNPQSDETKKLLLSTKALESNLVLAKGASV